MISLVTLLGEPINPMDHVCGTCHIECCLGAILDQFELDKAFGWVFKDSESAMFQSKHPRSFLIGRLCKPLKERLSQWVVGRLLERQAETTWAPDSKPVRNSAELLTDLGEYDKHTFDIIDIISPHTDANVILIVALWYKSIAELAYNFASS